MTGKGEAEREKDVISIRPEGTLGLNKEQYQEETFNGVCTREGGSLFYDYYRSLEAQTKYY